MTRRNIWRRILSVVLAVVMVGGVFISLGINSTAAVSVVPRDINGNIIFPAGMKADCDDAWEFLIDMLSFASLYLDVDIAEDEDWYDAECENRIRDFFGMGIEEMFVLLQSKEEGPLVAWYNLKATVIAVDVLIVLLAARAEAFPDSVLSAKSSAEQVLSKYENYFMAWLAEQTAAEPIATIPDGLYAIVGKASGKAIATGIADENGKECFILTYNPESYKDQVFSFQRQSDGSYVIISNYDGRYLEVQGASLENGAPVQVWQNNGQSNIYWNIYSAGNGYYTIVNRNSGKALDIFWGYTADYSVVDQWERNGTDAQLFRLEMLDEGSGYIDPPDTGVGDKPAELKNKWIWFDSQVGAGRKHLSVDFSDTLFDSPASTFNYKLALAAAGLSAAATSKKDAIDALKELGFNETNISQKNCDSENSYDVVNTAENIKHTVGYTFATKQIIAGEKRYNLVTIVVRGTANEGEWFSNFMLKSKEAEQWNDFAIPDFHWGFSLANNNLLDALDAYLLSIHNGLPTKYFVTGHSRGAAVANLTARALSLNNDYATKDNVYVYTFATPNVSKQSDVKNQNKFDNIFNFVNAEDFVPYLPLSVEGWNYWKYGKTLALNYNPTVIEKEKAVANFRELTGKDDLLNPSGYASDVQSAINEMKELASTPQEYYAFALRPPTISAYDFFKKVVDALNGKWQSLAAMLANGYYRNLTWFLMYGSDEISQNFRYGHAMDTYISWLQVYGSNVQFNTEKKGKYARISCPVDVQIYDSNNQLVGKVVNNVVDENITKGIAVSVTGENHDKKNVFLPSDQNYTFKLIGTDNGVMDYTVQDVDILTCEATQTKAFNNVELESGKTFTSTISGSVATPDVRLFVTDSSGRQTAEVASNGTEAPIQQTDNTKCIKLWGKTTKYPSNFLNWLLCILCFGWIWMALI